MGSVITCEELTNNDPLRDGLQPLPVGLLLTVVVLFVGAAVFVFDRRDVV